MKSFKSIFTGSLALLIILILVAMPISSAMAFSDGPNNPGSGSNDASIGTEIWSNPGNITTPGFPYATAVLYHLHRYSNYLMATQYGFAIPADAAIAGIEVNINRRSNSRNPNVIDNVVSLVKAGAIVGDNKAFSANAWPTVFTVATYGGPSDLWGTTWTPEEVNSADFGVVLAAYRDNNGNNARQAAVDNMQITVYYGSTSTTSLDCGTDPMVVYGDSVTCVATVSRLAGELTPSGTVSWTTDGGGLFAPNPCDLSGTDGTATCSATYTPNAVGTGSHLITATYDGDGTFTSSYASQPVTVTARPITVTADTLSKTYGDPDPAPTYQVTDGTLVFNDSFTGTLTREPGEDVALYAILQGSLALSVDYDLTYVGNFLSIYPATPACELTPYDVPYDGAEHSASGTCLGVTGDVLNGLDLSGTAHTDAGNYTDTWTFTDGVGNYLVASGNVNDVITPVGATCEVTPYSVTYDGNAHTATGSCTGVLGEAVPGLDLSGTTHTDVGVYSDTWAFNNSNYLDQNGTIEDVISSVDAVCEVTPYNVTYDGIVHTATGVCTGADGETLDGLDLSGTSHQHAGTYTDSWTFSNINYAEQSGTIEDVISTADAVCEITAYDVTYDGFFHTATGACTGVNGEPLSGLVLGGTTHRNAGSYTDAWSFSDGNGNYNSQSGTVDDQIGMAEAVCEITPYNVIYDGFLHTAAGACTGVSGETLNGLELSGTSHQNAGSYTDPWTFTDETGNYNNQAGSVPDQIGLADAACEVTPYDVTYDAASHSATGECLDVNGAPLSGLELLLTTHINAGTYNDPWTFTDVTGNYNDQNGTVTDQIDRADATCLVTPYLVEYDRNAHSATGECRGVLDEVLEGLDLTGTTHTDIGVYPADPWAFTDANGNYNAASGTVEDAITLRAITVAAEAKSKGYGQVDPVLTYQVTAGSLLASDAFNGSLTRQPGESAGTYAILQGTLFLPEYYAITYIGADFTITGSRYLFPLMLNVSGLK